MTKILYISKNPQETKWYPQYEITVVTELITTDGFDLIWTEFSLPKQDIPVFLSLNSAELAVNYDYLSANNPQVYEEILHLKPTKTFYGVDLTVFGEDIRFENRDFLIACDELDPEITKQFPTKEFLELKNKSAAERNLILNRCQVYYGENILEAMACGLVILTSQQSVYLKYFKDILEFDTKPLLANHILSLQHQPLKDLSLSMKRQIRDWDANLLSKERVKFFESRKKSLWMI